MSDTPDDLDMLAGEYVLGTLAGGDRRAFEARLKVDGAARAAVARWADRLAPMGEVLAGEAPPESLWRRIDAQMQAAHSRMRTHRGGAQGWRTFIGPRNRTLVWGGLGAIAAVVLAVVMVLGPWTGGARLPREVYASAQFNGEAGAPRYRVLVSADRRTVHVDPDGPAPPAGRVHELWVLEPGGAARSIGVLDPSRPLNLTPPEGVGAFLQRGAVVAISLEPEGGSPLDRPSGPVLLAATLAAPV
jgi:anti-sigma-K factor RskA